MGLWLRRALALLSLVSVGVLVLALLGLLPARTPAPPDIEKLDLQKAVSPISPLAVGDQGAQVGKSAQREVSWVPLCEAPESGARLIKVRVFPSEDALLVWCKRGYDLFTLDPHDGALRVTLQARFGARGELPGGAAAGDFDGDGQQDLALGVASRAGVPHRSGAGVFWVRGRAEGGFHAPRILMEASTSALASYLAQGESRHELVILTAGDITAQRPAELWLYGLQPALSRQKVVPVALDPRALALRAGASNEVLDAWVVSGQPGGLERIVFDLTTRDVRKDQALSLRLRGAQGFAHEPTPEGALFVRDATSVYRVRMAAEASMEPFAPDANVGPFVVTDLDRDLKPEALAVIEGGVAWLSGERATDYELPAELKALDVEAVRDAQGQAHMLLLATGKPDAATLALFLLPRLPWPTTEALTFSRGELGHAPGMAEVGLE